MRIFRFNEIDSTNKYLKEKIEIEDYDCVIAEIQTAGRGRRGNVWVSNKGMGIFSFALQEKKEKTIEEYMRLPLIAGISVLAALKKIEDLDYKFKWTNDIYIYDKKICGILIEKVREFFIIGIGININNCDFGYAQDNATSLKEITGKHYSTEDIIFCVINEFKKYLDQNWEITLKEINSYNYLKERDIEIVKDEKILGRGIAGDILKDGTLSVKINGKDECFNIGEIHIRK